MQTNECAVCLESLQTPVTLPCSHTFNAHCLLHILAQAVRNGSCVVPESRCTPVGARGAPCPVCRAPFGEADIGNPRCLGSDPLSTSDALTAALRDHARAREDAMRRVHVAESFGSVLKRMSIGLLLTAGGGIGLILIMIATSRVAIVIVEVYTRTVPNPQTAHGTSHQPFNRVVAALSIFHESTAGGGRVP